MNYLISILALLSCLWMGSAPLSILVGIFIAYVLELPDDFFTKIIGTKVLQTGIVFLGGSISVSQVIEITGSYFPWISLFVLTTFALGITLGIAFGVKKKQSYLLAAGTAICGGTAMATIAPVMKAKSNELTTALCIVFLLNAFAVVIFPFLNNYLQLSEESFGAWAALAIHDTASVIGAASAVGNTAVEFAATLKVGRTLWIIPLVVFTAWYFKEKRETLGLPLFVIFFIGAVVLNFLFSFSEEVTTSLASINRGCLTIGLFCIGTQIDKEAIRNISIRPVLQALSLWFVVIIASLAILT
ncbi:MAG: YeiH family protein [Gammaproteobacteria bacterium]